MNFNIRYYILPIFIISLPIFIIFKSPFGENRDINSKANIWAVPCDGYSECEFNEDEKKSLCTIPEEKTSLALVLGYFVIVLGILVILIYILRYKIDIKDPKLLLFGIDTEYNHETKPLNHLNLALIQKRDGKNRNRERKKWMNCKNGLTQSIYNEEMRLHNGVKPKVFHYFKV